MKKLLILTILIASSAISFAQHLYLEYFTAKEGIPTAFLLANENLNNKAVLTNILTSNDEFQINTIGKFNGDFIYEGEKAGQANFWIYIYISKDNSAEQFHVAVIKPSFMGSELLPFPTEVDISELQLATNEINTDNLDNSDEFIAKLADYTAYLSAIQTTIETGGSYIIGVGTLQNDYHCINANEMSWCNVITDNNNVLYCCKADYDDVSTLDCSNVDIEEIKDININIYPNPAKNFIYIENKDELITDIALYNEIGILITNFDNSITEINVSNIPAGNYFISITANNIKKFYPLTIVK